MIIDIMQNSCLKAAAMICLHFGSRVTNYISYMFKIWRKKIGKAWLALN